NATLTDQAGFAAGTLLPQVLRGGGEPTGDRVAGIWCPHTSGGTWFRLREPLSRCAGEGLG
ncbi:MAG: hypothetical protein R2853_11815, partial [Thermomicrobiales bacterium]